MTKTTQNAALQTQGATAAPSIIEFKNKLTTSVLNKVAEMQKFGIVVPKGYNPSNQIQLAFLKLSDMTTRDGKPILQAVKPASIANAMFTMCIKGLSLDKGQCAFIQYGQEVQLQVEYHGLIAQAKRCGAGDPQAQVIYEGDIFEYEIDPKSGKKRIVKHQQDFKNINNEKIIGAWCIVPYANGSEKPKVEIMTMEEIRKSWMQGATKGQSPAHRNFPQEMAKKTVIGRACKLFVSTSNDEDIDERYTDFVESKEVSSSIPDANTILPEFKPADSQIVITEETKAEAESAPIEEAKTETETLSDAPMPLNIFE